MVTVQEARQQVTQARQTLQSQEQQIQDARNEIKQTQLRALTRAELQVRGREDIITRKLQSQELEGLKKEQLTKLDPLDVQIKESRREIDAFDRQVFAVEEQVKEVKLDEAAFRKALDVFSDPDPRARFGLSGREEKFLRKIIEGKTTALRKAIKEAQESIRATGLTPVPIFENGKLIAFRGEEIIKKVKEVVKKITPPIRKGSRPLTQKEIDVLNIRDPLKFFVVSTLPEFGRGIFKDLVNNPKDRQAIRESLSKLQKRGDETIEKLEDTRVKVEEFFDPRQKEFRIETKKNFDILEGTQTVLNTDIERFNKKFVGELTQAEFDKATVQANTFIVRQRAIDQRTFELTEKVKILRGASEFQVETFFKSTLKGIATSPITLAQLGIAVSTRPIKTTKDFSKAIKELPSAFGTTPFSTAGQLFGTLVGTKLISDFIFASPQLFKGSRVPIGKADLENALRKGGKTLDDTIEQLRKFAKDKKGEITIQIVLKKKKKKKDGGLQELTDKLEDLNEIGDVTAKNKLIDESVKTMLSKIREAKTIEKQKQMILALNKAMKVWRGKGIIKLKPPIFELVRKPTRPIGSKKTASELRIVPQRRLQTARQKKLVSRFRKQKEEIKLFTKESSKLLKKQRQQLVSKQSIALALAQKSRQTQTQKDRQSFAAAFAQVSAQASKLESTQAETLKQSTALASALLSTQAQIVSSKLAPAQVLIGRPRVRVRVRAKPKPKLKIPVIIKLPKGVTETKLIKAIQKVGREGMDIIVGQKLKKQKTIGKNLPPFKALKKGLRFTDTNIEASFKLVKTGKKAKGKDIKPFNISKKFRPSKKNVLFLVEKRKFRLDHPREVKQLKLFKGEVPRGFFPKVKKRKKK